MASGANVNRGYDSALERDLARVLTELLGSVSWLQRWRIEPGMSRDPEWDLLVSGPVPGGGKAVLCVECKGINFQPSQFASLVGRSCSAGKKSRLRRCSPMPRVSPRMAELCQEHGWSWYDLAGNCRLEIPGVLLIERSGKEPVKAQPRSGANLGTARSRARRSRPARARECRPALDAAGDGRLISRTWYREFRRRALPS